MMLCRTAINFADCFLLRGVAGPFWAAWMLYSALEGQDSLACWLLIHSWSEEPLGRTPGPNEGVFWGQMGGFKTAEQRGFNKRLGLLFLAMSDVCSAVTVGYHAAA